ncbi:MAG: TlpA disulfide reductase family protein [Proteobacteria bacterium]|nr:TlpA disulfide reductase family protein [Pseudomonadota bacterium]
MKPLVRFALIAFVALAATAAGVFVADRNSAQLGDSGPTPDKALATRQLLALTLPDVSAVSQALSQWRGKLLVVNFWATWCSPCREEMPGFSRLQKKFANKGVQFVGIAFDNADKVQQYAVQTPVSYPLLIGTSGLLPITAGLGNLAGGLPFTVLIGRDGSLLETRLGIWKESAFEAMLNELTK